MARKAMTEEEKKAAKAKREEKARAIEATPEEEAEIGEVKAAADRFEAEKENANAEYQSAAIEEMRKQNEMLVAQLAEMKKQMEAMARPVIYQMPTDAPKVTFLWQAEVADDNTVTFGEHGIFGRIVGKVGTFTIPKNALSQLMDDKVRRWIDRRWLIVLGGLDEDEKELFGVNYKDGEILDKGAFTKLVELDDEIINIYPNLCDSHKDIVAKRFYDAWQNKNEHVTRERVMALNELARKAGRKNDFVKIIEEMNAADLDAIKD